MVRRLLSVLSVVAMGIFGFNADAIDLTSMKGHYRGVDSPVKALSREFGKSMPTTLKNATPQRVKAQDEPIASVNDAMSWGFLEGPDGNDWFYSQTFEIDGWYYTSTEITVYDSNHVALGTITIDAPEGESVNQMEPFGAVTTKFFDNDEESYEIAVFQHAVTADYVGKFWVDVYSLTGEKITTYDCESAMFFDASEGWTSYQRLITCASTDDGKIDINIYRPGRWDSDLPVLEHTFQIEEALINYMDASFINAYKVGGKPYYVLSHYEKEYMQPSEDFTVDPVATPDNTFVMKVYDKDYNEVSALNIPLEGNEDAYYTFAGFGIFSMQDLRKGEFTDDDQFNFIVTRYDYLLESDSYIYNFDVFDAEGNLVKNIAKRANAWLHLGSLQGYEDQVGIINTEIDEGCVEIINLPSCESEGVIPGIIDGRLISTNLDRCLAGDSYKYVISTSQGYYDEDGNVISSIGWYNRDFSIDHYTDFNAGPYAEYFTAYISSEALNPYLIESDDAYEFVYLVKERNQETDSLDNILYVAKEDGTVLRKFTNDEEKGLYYNGGFMNLAKTSPSLYIAYYDSDNYEYVFDFYELPFEKFAAGGDGSETNPYVISSVGDMQQIASDPAAHYILANDIDMAMLPQGWTPIPTLSGSFDGNNHTIKNMTINGDADYCGLFGLLDDQSSVKNLVLINPEITLTSQNYFIGAVAGMAVGATIDNVKVYDCTITGADNNGTIGGLIGQATSYSAIKNCAVNNVVIDTPAGISVGGIVGDTRTSTVVEVCYAGNDFSDVSKVVGSSEVGGIVGLTGMDCIVRNCHAAMDVVGDTKVGGIVGNSSSRGPIYNNIVEGTITVNKVNARNMANAGGVVGYLEADWMKTTKGTVVRKNVVKVKSITAPQGADAVGRIVGWTIADAEYEEDEQPRTEPNMKNNYAISDLTVNGETLQSSDATGVDGADLDLSTADRAFYEENGFVYGNDLSAPWKEGDEVSSPVLYMEGELIALYVDKTEEEAIEGEQFEINVKVYSADNNEIEFVSSDETVAKIVSVTASEEDIRLATAVIEIISEGSAEIEISCGELTEVCKVIGLSGVEEIATDNDVINYDGRNVICADASKIEIYSISGVRVASVESATLNVEQLASGIYIVVATDDSGKRMAQKIVVE